MTIKKNVIALTIGYMIIGSSWGVSWSSSYASGENSSSDEDHLKIHRSPSHTPRLGFMFPAGHPAQSASPSPSSSLSAPPCAEYFDQADSSSPSARLLRGSSRFYGACDPIYDTSEANQSLQEILNDAAAQHSLWDTGYDMTTRTLFQSIRSSEPKKLDRLRQEIDALGQVSVRTHATTTNQWAHVISRSSRGAECLRSRWMHGFLEASGCSSYWTASQIIVQMSLDYMWGYHPTFDAPPLSAVARTYHDSYNARNYWLPRRLLSAFFGFPWRAFQRAWKSDQALVRSSSTLAEKLDALRVSLPSYQDPESSSFEEDTHRPCRQGSRDAIFKI